MRRLAYLTASVALWTLSVLAFANVPVGAVVENLKLPRLAGGEHFFLSDSNVSVFIFIKPGMEHSNQAMREIAQVQKELAAEPVHWCAIVSDRVSTNEVEAAVRKASLEMPVLIDRGDRLYGQLGVILHPVVGVTDASRRLSAYQPFAQVNYANIIRAQVRHALKQISDEELAAVLHPVPVTLNDDKAIARRHLRLAEKQFAATNYNLALANLDKSLKKNPTAAAQILRGKIMVAQGKTNEAQTAFQAALKLEPTNSTALKELGLPAPAAH